MTNLQCSVDKCENNRSARCCRPNINVGGVNAEHSYETCCESYVQKTNSFSNSTQYSSPNQALEISCDASGCVFNKQEKCSADTISVNCSASGTECSSFKESTY